LEQRKTEKGEHIINIQTKNNDLNDKFAELLEDYENVRPHRGQIVKGEVLELTDNSVLLDVGAKRDAIVPQRELANLEDTMFEDIAIGDQLPVYVTHTSGYDDELLVSIEKGLEQQDWERAESYLASGETLELEVIGYNKGGLLVAFDRLNGFVPNSMTPGLPRGLSRNDKQMAKSKMIGETLKLKAIEVDQSKKRLVFSGRAAEEALRKQRLRELQAGEKVTGTVSNIVKFGAFVDLGGVDGLIHVSRLSWEKFDHPSEVLQPGDEVEVLIRDVDVERERVSLDRRALLPGPWDDFAREHNPGDILEGIVVSVRDFGAFVRLADEITGLLHVSELLPGVSREPTKVLNPGDEILVRIIEINPELEQVSLSMRRVPEDEIANWVIEQ
jgi:small subunit ribosomal protein S1